ncbi:MAG: hypothetical protein WB622_03645 [Acidobacteriaceae bacterium]
MAVMAAHDGLDDDRLLELRLPRDMYARLRIASRNHGCSIRALLLAYVERCLAEDGVAPREGQSGPDLYEVTFSADPESK